jgi:hypothetical protein
MGITLELTRATLHLEDRIDPIVAIIAKRIIELAKGGERDGKYTLRGLAASPFHPAS